MHWLTDQVIVLIAEHSCACGIHELEQPFGIQPADAFIDRAKNQAGSLLRGSNGSRLFTGLGQQFLGFDRSNQNLRTQCNCWQQCLDQSSLPIGKRLNRSKLDHRHDCAMRDQREEIQCARRQRHHPCRHLRQILRGGRDCQCPSLGGRLADQPLTERKGTRLLGWVKRVGSDLGKALPIALTQIKDAVQQFY